MVAGVVSEAKARAAPDPEPPRSRPRPTPREDGERAQMMAPSEAGRKCFSRQLSPLAERVRPLPVMGTK